MGRSGAHSLHAILTTHKPDPKLMAPVIHMFLVFISTKNNKYLIIHSELFWKCVFENKFIVSNKSGKMQKIILFCVFPKMHYETVFHLLSRLLKCILSFVQESPGQYFKWKRQFSFRKCIRWFISYYCLPASLQALFYFFIQIFDAQSLSKWRLGMKQFYDAENLYH